MNHYGNSVDIRLPHTKVNLTKNKAIGQIVVPSEVITTEPGFMRGHGTFIENEKLISSMTGVVNRINKLIFVSPLKSHYNGEIGDVIVGRVTEVSHQRWKIDTNSRLDSNLQLSAVNLPGNEMRRRTADDELLMRECFGEGDLIAAEVQSISHSDRSLSLHRVKTGQPLEQGSFLKVQSALIERTKTHYITLPCNVLVVLGINGYVWITLPFHKEESQYEQLQRTDENQKISKEDRENIARVRNCISLLNSNLWKISHSLINRVYILSLDYTIKEILDPEIQDRILVSLTNDIDD